MWLRSAVGCLLGVVTVYLIMSISTMHFNCISPKYGANGNLAIHFILLQSGNVTDVKIECEGKTRKKT